MIIYAHLPKIQERNQAVSVYKLRCKRAYEIKWTIIIASNHLETNYFEYLIRNLALCKIECILWGKGKTPRASLLVRAPLVV